jgi:hypothetical protein
MVTRAEANFEWDHSDRVCLVCGDMYTPVRYTQKFCPPPKKCRNSQAARRMSAEIIKYPRICKDCGTSFTPRATDQTRCGMSCPGKPPLVKICSNAFCAKEFVVTRQVSPGRQIYCSRDCNRAEERFQKHGLSSHGYLELLELQGGRCAGCGYPIATGERAHIDHDHAHCPGQFSCGQCIRGLMHGNCNMTEGLFKDHPERLQGLANYMVSRA